MKLPLPSDIWIAKVHLVARDGCHPFPSPSATGAYTNCITQARDESEFKDKVRALLGPEGFEVTEFEDPERLADRGEATFDPEDRAALKEILKLIAQTNLEHEAVTTEIHTYSE